MFSSEKLAFYDAMDAAYLSLTFDDVRVETAQSFIDKAEISLHTLFTRNVELKMPFVSAAMDTVTTSPMAIEMARLGGIGVIHSALEPEDQKREVRAVKLAMNGRINSPITFYEDQTIQEILRECDERNFSFRTFPIINRDGKFSGLLTQNDFDLCRDVRVEARKQMTKAKRVTTVPNSTSAQEAYDLMLDLKKKTLPVLSKSGKVKGLYLLRDVANVVKGNHAYNLDCNGQLRVAAAVPTDETALERLELMAKYLDVVVIDSSQGDSKYMLQTLKEVKATYGDSLDVMAGNITNPESAKALLDAGADGIKVGQGGGSICTTREKTGTGKPQVTAVYQVARMIGKAVPICSDGGIRNTGDTVIALAAGADTIMMGRVLAAHDESAGETVRSRDGTRGKIYRGMGSLSAMRESAASRARYGSDLSNLLPEGVESFVPLQGKVADTIKTYIGYMRRGMSLAGTESISDHQKHAMFTRITNAGLAESHAHDVTII